MLSPEDEIQIIELDQSVVSMLHLGFITTVISAILIGVDSFVGIYIKGLIMYYVKYKAPKDRPINRMILLDQVCYISNVTHVHVCFYPLIVTTVIFWHIHIRRQKSWNDNMFFSIISAVWTIIISIHIVIQISFWSWFHDCTLQQFGNQISLQFFAVDYSIIKGILKFKL